MGKAIATFLNLPNSNLYTGHCFRRSSATILIDAGGDLISLKRHGEWKSAAVAETYTDESVQNKANVRNQILNSVEDNEATNAINIMPSTSTTFTYNITKLPMQLHFNNCTIQHVPKRTKCNC